MELPINAENFVRIIQGVCPCRAFKFPDFIKFKFWSPVPHTCIDEGEFGMEELTCSCGVKNPKINL